MSIGDYVQLEQAGRDQAKACIEKAQEAIDAGSSVGVREWWEAAGAALQAVEVAQHTRLEAEEHARERARA